MEAEGEDRRPLMRQQQLSDPRQQQQQAVVQQRPPVAGLHQEGGEERGDVGARSNPVEAALLLPAQNEEEAEEPLLVKPITCSYRTLLNLLGTLDFGRKSILGFKAPPPRPPPPRVAGVVGESDTITTTTTITPGHLPPAKRQKKAAAAAAVHEVSNVSGSNKSSSSQLLVLPHELCVRVIQYLTIQRVNPNQVVVTGCSSHDGAHVLSSCLDEDDDTWWLSAPGSMPNGRGNVWIQFALAPKNNSLSSSSSSSSLPSAAAASAASSSSSSHTGGTRKTSNSRLCRLSSISMKIPPLPQGPLSVLEFSVQRFCNKTKTWYNVANNNNNNNATNAIMATNQVQVRQQTPLSFSLENRTGWQQFRLVQELDVDEVRIVCLRNQISPSVERIIQTSSSTTAAAGTTAADNALLLVQQLSRFDSVGFIAIRFD